MKRKLIVATTNEGKLREIRELFDGTGYEVFSMGELGITADIDENGSTFAENAAIKAQAIHGLTGAAVLADDSGLEVDYLDKAPGIYSARYMGEDTSYDIKNRHIIELLKGVGKDERTARFVCAMVCILEDGSRLDTYETVEGTIACDIKGGNGFGYDPVFFVEEYGCTLAELDMETKNKISHRGKALRAMFDKLNAI